MKTVIFDIITTIIYKMLFNKKHDNVIGIESICIDYFKYL